VPEVLPFTETRGFRQAFGDTTIWHLLAVIEGKGMMIALPF
jgi:hypothetical protein